MKSTRDAPRMSPEEVRLVNMAQTSAKLKPARRNVSMADHLTILQPPRSRQRLKELMSVDSRADDKERVRVEHYIHDKSFRERLKFYFITNQRHRIRWQIVRLILKVASCVLYVLRAMQDSGKAKGFGCEDDNDNKTSSSDWHCPKDSEGSDYHAWSLLWVDRPFWIWLLQTIIAIYCLVETCFLIFLTSKSTYWWRKLFDLVLFSEFIFGVPFIVSLFYPAFRHLYVPLFFNCWLAKRTLEALLTSDLHKLVLRQQSALMQKCIIVVTTVVCILFTSVCGINHLQRAKQEWDFFECLWFVVVTFSTVGYGEYTPDDWPTQTFVMIMIMISLVTLPLELEQLAFLLVSRQKEGGAYNRVLGGEKAGHVVLCATALRPAMLIDFLNEFYSSSSTEIHVVLLCPSDLDNTLRLLLQVPVWAQRVTYLKGSALIDDDLVRARMEHAKACFILADRYAGDRDAADKHTILRTWAIQDFAPDVPLYVQILKPENKFHVSFAEHVVCEDELKHALFASNCVCPGLSTLVTLLIHTLHEQRGSEDCEWHKVYGTSAGNEIYDIRLGDSMIFRPFNNKSFTSAAFHAHKKYGVTLIAVKRKGSRIMLNPGNTYTMKYDDRCFYIAISREEDTAFKAYKEPKNLRKLHLSQKSSFITASSVALELSDADEQLAVKAVSLKGLERGASNGVNHLTLSGGDSDQVDTIPRGAELRAEKDPRAVAFDIGDSRRSSNSGFVPDEFSLDDDSEIGLDAVDLDTSRIPSYKEGFPPVSPYIGRTPVMCHLLRTPKSPCCLNLNAKPENCPHRDLNDGGLINQKHHSAIIVSSPVAEAGLYNFILPLRAYHRPKFTLKPIILLTGEKPSQDFLEAVCCFPMLYYMVGTIKSLDDLLVAGCLHADSLVVIGHKSHCDMYEEEHMADANTIVDVQTIYRLFPNSNLIVEITHTSNMRFMKFNADIVPGISAESVASFKESIRRRVKEQNKRDHLNYMFRDPFAAGHVFSMSMLDTLLYQTFVKDYMIHLISLLLGLQQAPNSGYLCALRITTDHLWIGSYGRLFQRLCSTTEEIPIGLYRTEMKAGEDQEDGFLRGPKTEIQDISEIIMSRIKTLDLVGSPDLKHRPGFSYVIVNPEPDYMLQEGDVVYLIRPCNISRPRPQRQTSRAEESCRREPAADEISSGAPTTSL